MLKRLGPTLVLALVVAMTLTLSASAATASRTLSKTRGLDYLHASQLPTGGFSDSATTAWTVLAISASNERPGRWRVDGKSPVDDYLQSLSLELAAAGTSNRPEYYARLILAYVAADEREKLDHAGSARIDLVGKLLAYEDIADHHFSPQTTAPSSEASIRTTAWAILALKAANEPATRIAGAVDWLKTQPEAGGGFASEPGRSANPEDTALAIMALHAGGGLGTGSAVVGDAVDYLKGTQRSNGGFPSRSSNDHSYAEPTALVICALNSVSLDPANWEKTKGATPYTYLRGLQRGSGAFSHTVNDPTDYPDNAATTTAEAVLALSGKSLPLKPVGNRRSRAFLPYFRSLAPGSGARFTSGTVTVRATYRDPATGTGISARAITVLVDSVSMTKPAHIASSSLYLHLHGLTSGTHTFAITIADKAGNLVTKQRSFSVTLPTPSSTPSSTPSGTPSGRPSTRPSTSPSPTVLWSPTPTPTTTLTSPFPSASPSPGYPYSSSSPSPSGTAVASGDGPTSASGGDWARIALLTLLPIGGGLAYFAFQHRLGLLSGASAGTPLAAAGGTTWSRFKARAFGASSWLRLPRR